VCELNHLFGNLFGGGGLVDLHRDSTITGFYKKSSQMSVDWYALPTV
jgi:hypothetical protein